MKQSKCYSSLSFYLVQDIHIYIYTIYRITCMYVNIYTAFYSMYVNIYIYKYIYCILFYSNLNVLHYSILYINIYRTMYYYVYIKHIYLNMTLSTRAFFIWGYSLRWLCATIHLYRACRLIIQWRSDLCDFLYLSGSSSRCIKDGRSNYTEPNCFFFCNSFCCHSCSYLMFLFFKGLSFCFADLLCSFLKLRVLP